MCRTTDSVSVEEFTELDVAILRNMLSGRDGRALTRWEVMKLLCHDVQEQWGGPWQATLLSLYWKAKRTPADDLDNALREACSGLLRN